MRAFEAGRCDLTPGYGEWLREGQERIDNGCIDGILVFFCLPGVYPRALASNLIYLLTSEESLGFAQSFLRESAWYFTDKEDKRMADDAAIILQELTPEECTVTLMAIARWLRGPLEEPVGERQSRELLQWANMLLAKAADNEWCRRHAANFETRIRDTLYSGVQSRGGSS